MSRVYIPSDEQRRTVRAMAAFGVPQDAIAAHFNLDPKTLRKHHRVELDRGTVEANVKVAQSLFTMATAGNNVAAAIFWMKARAGWREKNDLQITGKDGTPLETAPLIVHFVGAADGRPTAPMPQKDDTGR